VLLKKKEIQYTYERETFKIDVEVTIKLLANLTNKNAGRPYKIVDGKITESNIDREYNNHARLYIKLPYTPDKNAERVITMPVHTSNIFTNRTNRTLGFLDSKQKHISNPLKIKAFNEYLKNSLNSDFSNVLVKKQSAFLDISCVVSLPTRAIQTFFSPGKIDSIFNAYPKQLREIAYKAMEEIFSNHSDEYDTMLQNYKNFFKDIDTNKYVPLIIDNEFKGKGNNNIEKLIAYDETNTIPIKHNCDVDFVKTICLRYKSDGEYFNLTQNFNNTTDINSGCTLTPVNVDMGLYRLTVEISKWTHGRRFIIINNNGNNYKIDNIYFGNPRINNTGTGSNGNSGTGNGNSGTGNGIKGNNGNSKSVEYHKPLGENEIYGIIEGNMLILNRDHPKIFKIIVNNDSIQSYGSKFQKLYDDLDYLCKLKSTLTRDFDTTYKLHSEGIMQVKDTIDEIDVILNRTIIVPAIDKFYKDNKFE